MKLANILRETEGETFGACMQFFQRYLVSALLVFFSCSIWAQDAVYVQTIKEQINQGLITQAQGDQQLQAAAIKQRQSLAPQVKLITFEITRADTSLQNLLSRWGADTGWRVMATDLPSIRINGEAELVRPDFISAADFVITQARSLGHKLNAEAFSNNVLVLSPVEK